MATTNNAPGTTGGAGAGISKYLQNIPTPNASTYAMSNRPIFRPPFFIRTISRVPPSAALPNEITEREPSQSIPRLRKTSLNCSLVPSRESGKIALPSKLQGVLHVQQRISRHRTQVLPSARQRKEAAL